MILVLNVIFLQPIKEAALSSIPTIAFCDTDSPMRYVDIGIPANNKGKHSIGCLFWLLGRMVLQMRGVIAPGHKWDVMVKCLETFVSHTLHCGICAFLMGYKDSFKISIFILSGTLRLCSVINNV